MRESALSKAIRSAFAARGARPIKYHGGPYSEAGIPDLLVCYRGFFVYIETKGPGEKPTPIQEARMHDLRQACAIGGVAYNVDDAIGFLAEIDCLFQNLEFKYLRGSLDALSPTWPNSLKHFLELYT